MGGKKAKRDPSSFCTSHPLTSSPSHTLTCSPSHPLTCSPSPTLILIALHHIAKTFYAFCENFAKIDALVSRNFTQVCRIQDNFVKSSWFAKFDTVLVVAPVARYPASFSLQFEIPKLAKSEIFLHFFKIITEAADILYSVCVHYTVYSIHYTVGTQYYITKSHLNKQIKIWFLSASIWNKLLTLIQICRINCTACKTAWTSSLFD